MTRRDVGEGGGAPRATARPGGGGRGRRARVLAGDPGRARERAPPPPEPPSCPRRRRRRDVLSFASSRPPGGGRRRDARCGHGGRKAARAAVRARRIAPRPTTSATAPSPLARRGRFVGLTHRRRAPGWAEAASRAAAPATRARRARGRATRTPRAGSDARGVSPVRGGRRRLAAVAAKRGGAGAGDSLPAGGAGPPGPPPAARLPARTASLDERGDFEVEVSVVRARVRLGDVERGRRLGGRRLRHDNEPTALALERARRVRVERNLPPAAPFRDDATREPVHLHARPDVRFERLHRERSRPTDAVQLRNSDPLSGSSAEDSDHDVRVQLGSS